MINIAVLGLGYIAGRVCEGIHYVKNANLYCVVSRDENKAIQFKEKFQAEHYYSDYETMLKDNNVDLVYICTPNHLHIQQIELCFKYHKHVVCEKPMVSSASEIKYLFHLARQSQCFLMEAEKTVFTPLNLKVKQMIDDGVIGELQAIKADYSYSILDLKYPRNHWAFHDVYGGSSYDVGVYPICFANYYSNSKIHNVQAMSKSYQDYKCDFYMQANVQYDNHIMATLTSSWLYTSQNRGTAYLYGSKGYIEIPSYWKLNRAILVKDEVETIISVNQDSDFTGEIEHAVNCIEQGLLESNIMGENASLEIMKVLEIANQNRKD